MGYSRMACEGLKTKCVMAEGMSASIVAHSLNCCSFGKRGDLLLHPLVFREVEDTKYGRQALTVSSLK
jgi:hypothetical protein